ncbi:hypothetical protein KP509_32G036100 [Ceratopteris richardii]|nr:hypothetical protein KP509_32G036100 [Ceratopteris richardii]
MVEARVNKYFPVSVVLPIHLVLPIPEVRNSAAAEESCSSSLPSYSEDLEEQKRLMFLLASLLRPTARSGRALPGTPFYWSASRSGQIR